MNNEKLIDYFLSKKFWNQIKIMLAIFFAIIFSSSIILHCYTRHGQYIVVPNFTNVSIQQAQKLAKDNSLRLEVIDSVFNLDILPGFVIEQDPNAGTKVKKNRRILVIINSIEPKYVIMPNIIGVSLRQALPVLEADGLMVGRITYVPDIAMNLVLKCNFKGKEIKAGDKIAKGSYINIVLGNSGNLKNVEVPDLLGLGIREARKRLVINYLNIGKIVYKQVYNAEGSLKAIIVKQKPEFGTLLMGSNVDVWLTVKNDSNHLPH